MQTGKVSGRGIEKGNGIEKIGYSNKMGQKAEIGERECDKNSMVKIMLHEKIG